MIEAQPSCALPLAQRAAGRIATTRFGEEIHDCADGRDPDLRLPPSRQTG